jgi:hypothetical protein
MSITKASLIDLNGQELILDADADTSITADTDDQIDIRIAGSDVITLTNSAINIGSATLNNNAILKLQTEGSDVANLQSAVQFRSHNDDFGITMQLESEASSNDILNVKYHNNSSGGISVLQVDATNGNVVFNEDSNDIDFRVESNGQANMLIVDGGSDVVLVGTNTINPQSASSGGNEGCMFGRGLITAGRAGGEIAIFNRQSSDGDVVLIRKDGTTVGTIATEGGDMAIGNDDVGLQFINGGKVVRGFDISANDKVDAAVDLGMSTTRFKDLYLSGGVFLGGTGSDNKLDDYEEGTHDCTVTMGSGSCSLYANYNKIKYTKVGRLVTIQGQIRVESVSSPSGEMQVSMPFSIDTTEDEGANLSGSVVRTYNGNAPTGGLFLHGVMVFNRSDKVVLAWVKSGAATVDHTPVAGEYLLFNFSYCTA